MVRRLALPSLLRLATFIAEGAPDVGDDGSNRVGRSRGAEASHDFGDEVFEESAGRCFAAFPWADGVFDRFILRALSMAPSGAVIMWSVGTWKL